MSDRKDRLDTEEILDIGILRLAPPEDPEDYGMQEKFLKAVLLSTERPTELDIERFFHYLGMAHCRPEAVIAPGETDTTQIYRRLFNHYLQQGGESAETLAEFITLFYRTQLENIRLTPTQLGIFTRDIQAKFENGQLRPDALNHFLSDAPMLEAIAAFGSAIHPCVENAQRALNLYQSHLTFPSAEPNPPLNSVDYGQFLALAHAYLKGANIEKPLDTLTLNCTDDSALWGVASYCNTYKNPPFETLNLNFLEDATLTDDPSALVHMLKKLSDTSVQAIKLNGPLTDTYLAALADAIEATPEVTVVITLAHPNTVAQQRLDNVLLDRARTQHIQALTETVTAKAEAEHKRLNRKPRDRKNRKTTDVQFDVEIQEEAETSIQAETSTEASAENPGEGSTGDTLVYGTNDFIHALCRQELTWPGPERFSLETMSPKQYKIIRNVWKNWQGLLSLADEQKLNVSHSACEVLLAHPETFAYGLDLTRLPPGFMIKEGEGRSFIDFDANLKRLIAPDKLAVRTLPPVQKAALTPGQLARYRGEALAADATYDRAAAWAERQAIPSNLQTDAEKIDFLKRISDGEAEATEEKIKTLQTLVPDIRLDALVQLYLTHSESGLDRLIQMASLPHFLDIHAPIFQRAESYAPAMQPEFEAALGALQGFSAAERQYFLQLLTQHASAQSQTDLLDMVDAFKAFKEELRSLELPEGQTLSFDIPPKFSDVKSLPAALSRMLYILKHVAPHNRQAQWQVLSELDLSSTGAINAITHITLKKWAFITPEMRMNAQHQAGVDPDGTQDSYGSLSFWSIIYDPDLDTAIEKFFRHVAHQKPGEQLPLAFYQHVKTELDPLDTELQAWFYPLIAGATVNLGTRQGQITLDESEHCVSEFIKTINGLALHEIKLDVLKTLSELDPPPCFPILNRLTSLIASCCRFTNPLRALANVEKLKEANKLLRRYLENYGTNIYDGMLYYTEADYKHTTLFYDHLAVITKLKDTFTGDYQNVMYVRLIAAIISTFHLTEENIDALHELFSNKQFEARNQELLSILKHLTLPNDVHLKLEDLTQLITAVQSDERPVILHIKADDLSQHFSEHFLTCYGTSEVSQTLKHQITEAFPEHHNAILSLLARTDNALYYDEIIKNLVALCDAITSPVEKNVFLNKLTKASSLAQAIPAHTDVTPSLIVLLDAIKKDAAHHVFIGFMNAARLVPEAQADLAERALFYIQHALPAFYALKSAGKPQAFTEIEITPLIQHLSLYLPINTPGSPEAFTQLLEIINTLGTDNPVIKKPLLQLLHHASKTYNTLETLKQFADSLEAKFAAIEDKNTVLSLVMHFSQQPETLIALFDAVGERETLLKTAVALLNSGKGFDITAFKALCTQSETNPRLMQFLEEAYQKAPFPSLQEIKYWQGENRLKNTYRQFEIEPAPRELKDNGFHADKARAQLKIMQDTNPDFEPDIIDVDAFETLAAEMRLKTPDELLAIFNGFKDVANPDYDTLVAVAAELLYRSKGQDKRDIEGKHVPGSSMEINTTQYLAILTALKTPGHTTSQIGTGEGKTRIMMISNICQYALGHTVDFVTSDVQLASRDFVEFKPLFDMVGAKTSMIFANSSPDTYQMGGINFSDPSSLSLFRNKARSLGKGAHVIDPDIQRRALLLDEADKTYFDMVDTRFNYSREGDDAIRDMPWVYESLIEYFENEEKRQLYIENIDESREDFLRFIEGTRTNQTDINRLRGVSEEKLEEWQDSAITALRLKYQVDFLVSPDELIKVPGGQKISSTAKLVAGQRAASGASFSLGVQQCLHARLNRARQNLSAVKDLELKAALGHCETQFAILDEKQIIYSSTNKNMMDDYDKGVVQAVTGTGGSMLEREEARALFSQQSGAEHTPMHYINVPRHKGLKRLDRAVQLSRNETQQVEDMIQAIKTARSKSQPILLFTENDKESEILCETLKTHPLLQDFVSDIQRVHGQMSAEDENAAVSAAGYPGKVTVSTGMIGRGTDIALQGDAKKEGLNVMLTYLPRERDLEQMVGRSGRFGKRGETRIFLNKKRLKQQIDTHALGSGGYYYNPEAFLRHEQAIMDRKKQCERLIKYQFSDFKRALQDRFFDEFLPHTQAKDRKALRTLWTQFTDKMDKQWNAGWADIQAELQKDTIDTNAIEHLLHARHEEIETLWRTLQTDAAKVAENTAALNQALPNLTLSQSAKDLLEKPLEKSALHIHQRYNYYDPAHDGRYVLYTSWTIPAAASLRGWANLIPFVNFENARVPFANTRAWWAGRGQIFSDYYANKGKYIGSLVMGLIGAAVMGGLIFTGLIVPATLLAMVGAVAASFVAGALTGFIGGAVVDTLTQPATQYVDPPEIPDEYDEPSPDTSPENDKQNSTYARFKAHGLVDLLDTIEEETEEDLAEEATLSTRSDPLFKPEPEAAKPEPEAPHEDLGGHP